MATRRPSRPQKRGKQKNKSAALKSRTKASRPRGGKKQVQKKTKARTSGKARTRIAKRRQEVMAPEQDRPEDEGSEGFMENPQKKETWEDETKPGSPSMPLPPMRGEPPPGSQEG